MTHVRRSCYASSAGFWKVQQSSLGIVLVSEETIIVDDHLVKAAVVIIAGKFLVDERMPCDKGHQASAQTKQTRASKVEP